MTAAGHELKASYAFVERNFNLSRRYWGWEIAYLVYAIAGALAISLIGAQLNDRRLILSLMIGATFWNYLSIVFSFIADTIAWERWEGTLEYTMMAPIRRRTQLLGSTLYAILYGLVHTAVVLVVLALFFGLDMSRANIGTAAAFMVLGSFSFVGIGIMAAVLPLLFVERGSQMTFVLQSLLLLVSGVYAPDSVRSGLLGYISPFSPATHVLDAVRAALTEGTTVTALLPDVGALVVMGVVLVPLGLGVFARAERFAKRTGRLKRVG